MQEFDFQITSVDSTPNIQRELSETFVISAFLRY